MPCCLRIPTNDILILLAADTCAISISELSCFKISHDVTRFSPRVLQEVFDVWSRDISLQHDLQGEVISYRELQSLQGYLEHWMGSIIWRTFPANFYAIWLNGMRDIWNGYLLMFQKFWSNWHVDDWVDILFDQFFIDLSNSENRISN